MDIVRDDWEHRLEYLRGKKKQPGVEFADELQQEYDALVALEHHARIAAEDEAIAKGWRAEPAPTKRTEREATVARIENEIGQSLPSQFHSGPLPVKANLLCASCGYDRSKSLYVVIEKDRSARWECHNSSCDLDGQIGKRWGKPAVGPEAVLEWDDDDQRRFARHYLYTDLPDVLRKRLMFEEDEEFDAGPGEPIAFLNNFSSYMSFDATARKYWNRALDRYSRDLFALAKAAGRTKVKMSGRPWPPKYIANDRTIMGRGSTRKLITEIYPYVRDRRWAKCDCVEWRSQNPDWQAPDEYDGIIAPILVTLNADKTAKALDLSRDRVWAYLRAMESVGLIQRINHLKHGRRLWSCGYWQQTSRVNTAARWFLKNDPKLLARLRAVQP